MLRVLLSLVFALTVPIDAFAEQPRLLDVLSIYRDLNDMCRDPSADDHHKLAACDVREKVSRLLNRMGYCYGKDGQDATAVHWHKCVAHEIF